MLHTVCRIQYAAYSILATWKFCNLSSLKDDYREDDGIHWTAVAHRYLSNIFLTHISESWGIGWPSYPCKDSHGYVKNMFNGVPMSELRDCVKEYEEQTGYDPRPKMQDNFKKDNNAARLY